MSDPTVTIIHPADPRNDGKPLAVTLRKPSNAETAEREEKMADEEQAHAVIGTDGKPIPGVFAWRRPSAGSGSKGTREYLQFRLVSCDNPPDGKSVTKDDISPLLDDRFNVPVDEVTRAFDPNSKLMITFAVFACLEFLKHVWPSPTVPSSVPSS